MFYSIINYLEKSYLQRKGDTFMELNSSEKNAVSIFLFLHICGSGDCGIRDVCKFKVMQLSEMENKIMKFD
jgi:hypothetical protein